MSYEPGTTHHRILFVANPSSGSSAERVRTEIQDALRKAGEVSVLLPSSHDAFFDEVADASEAHDVVVVGGGDGTFSDAVNALSDRLDRLRLALLPMGTGNDLSRTLGLAEDPVEVARGLSHAREVTLDVCRAAGGTTDKLFVNACAGGLPVAVDKAVRPTVKKMLGPLAFFVAGAKGLMDTDRFTVTINGHEAGDCLMAGVGNGKTAGGGYLLWPDADPTDGRLAAVALSVSDASEGLAVARSAKNGSITELDNVYATSADKIEISAAPDIEFNVDGDLFDLTTPATFEVVGKVQMLVPTERVDRLPR